MGVFGAGLLVAAFTLPAPKPPQPVAEANPPAPVTTASPKPGLPRSEPTRVVIPRIKVNADLMQLGVTGDGSIEVPPLKQADRAGWYKLGPSPGEAGSSVIVGHVDSRAMGPAVFFKLGSLRKGDVVQVTRKDKKVITFTVDAVRSYPKTAFPTDEVYAPTSNPTLRLVTCGGTFDRKQRSYLNNIVVYATIRT